MIERYRAGFLLVACCLSGCASSPSSVPEKVRTGQNEGVAVSLELETPRKDGLGGREVLPGETLGDGDMLAMKISVDRPAHVYLLRAPATGASSVLYPEKGDEEAQPGKVVRVPAQGAWFKVTGEQGMENVVVVASARALAPEAVLDAQQHPTPLLSDSIAAQTGDDKKADGKGKGERPPCNPKVNDECKRGDCYRPGRAGRASP